MFVAWGKQSEAFVGQDLVLAKDCATLFAHLEVVFQSLAFLGCNRPAGSCSGQLSIPLMFARISAEVCQ
jgi:hypothetical protein